MGYEIMTLMDDRQRERGAVFVNTETERVLDLEVFPEAEDAHAFYVWMLNNVYANSSGDFFSCSLGWLESRRDEWNKAKQESVLAALGDAIDG